MQGASNCPNCGAALDIVLSANVSVLRKKPGLSLVLAGLVGALFMGVAHFYLGRIGRGVAILLAGILTGIVFIAAMAGAFFTIGIIFGIGRMALWIWQTLDAHILTKRYNDVLESTGKPPW